MMKLRRKQLKGQELHVEDMRKAGEIVLRELGKSILRLEDVIKMDRKRIGDNFVDSGRGSASCISYPVA
jgi:hypothetical protein